MTGFVLGARQHATGAANADVDAPSVSWTTVTQKKASPVELTGTVQAGASVTVSAALPQDASLLVVTRMDVHRGQTISPGTLLGVVSGRPVILVRNSFAFYRDLHPGDEGDDVTALQSILRAAGAFTGTPDGRFGAETQKALTAYYETLGQEPVTGGADAEADVVQARAALRALDNKPGSAQRTEAEAALQNAELEAGAWLPLGEFAAIDAARATVLTAEGKGSELDEGDPLVRLKLGRVTFRARADALDVESFTVGSKVTVTLNGTADDLPGRVLRIGKFTEPDGSEGSFAGQDIVVSFTKNPDLEAGSTGTLRVADARSAKHLAVPLVGLYEDTAGTYVLRKEATSDPQGERVAVTVLAQESGWALVEGELAVGDDVRIGS